MNRRRQYLGLDLLMTALLLCETGWSITGDTAHELIGTVLTVCLALHLYWHRNWFITLFKLRAWQQQWPLYLCNALLLLTLLLTLVSGFGGSLLLYQLTGLSLDILPRTLHTFSAYWLFILLGVHLGLHRPLLVRSILDLTGATPHSTRVIAGHWLMRCALPAGIYAVYHFDLWQKLAGVSTFGLILTGNQIAIYFLLHLALLLAVLQLTHWLNCLRIRHRQLSRSLSVAPND